MRREIRCGRELVRALAKGVPAARALAELELTWERGRSAMNMTYARREREARLAVLRVQTELLAAEQVPLAIQRFREVLEDETAGAALKLKAAMAVMGLASKPGGRGRMQGEEAGEEAVEPVRREEIDGMIRMLEAMKGEAGTEGA